ncbi:uncharacterized protein LOC141908556 [Tubulanus polymorphus]|uniref:uncharacterized protein LOC141908556 n=1 Tax=Tubulanus polymorphus TaxID=672921 RepID=UPI003DA45315
MNRSIVESISHNRLFQGFWCPLDLDIKHIYSIFLRSLSGDIIFDAEIILKMASSCQTDDRTTKTAVFQSTLRDEARVGASTACPVIRVDDEMSYVPVKEIAPRIHVPTIERDLDVEDVDSALGEREGDIVNRSSDHGTSADVEKNEVVTGIKSKDPNENTANGHVNVGDVKVSDEGDQGGTADENIPVYTVFIPEVLVKNCDTENDESSTKTKSQTRNSTEPNRTDSIIDPATEETEDAMILCKWMIRKPVLFFVLFLSFHVFFAAFTGILYGIGYNVLPIDFESIPVSLHDHQSYKSAETWRHRNSRDIIRFHDRYTIDHYKSLPLWTRGFPDRIVELYYEDLTVRKNMLTRDQLKRMRDIENELFNEPQWKIYCRLLQNKSCDKPTSVLRFFDGTYEKVSAVFYDPNFDNIDDVIKSAFNNSQTRNGIILHLGSDSQVVEGSPVRSKMLRSFFTSGAPIDGHRSRHSITQFQLKEIALNYLKKEFRALIEDLRDRFESHIGLYYFEDKIYVADIRTQAYKDLALTAGSFLFIAFFLVFHTRSTWVSFWGMIGVFSSFVISNLIYRIVFGYQYFGLFHILSIFIIIGIGADDMFIFYDTWRSTEFKRYPSLEHRLSDAYRRAAGAMFATSLTTMIAFFISAFSPLLMVQSFGVFSGLLIIVNYLTVITFFPAVIIIYHLKFEGRCGSCCCRCGCCCCCKGPCANFELNSNQIENIGQNRLSGKTQKEEQRTKRYSLTDGKNAQSKLPSILAYKKLSLDHETTEKFGIENKAFNLDEMIVSRPQEKQLEPIETCLHSNAVVDFPNVVPDTADSTADVPAEKKKMLLVRFFGGPYFRLIDHKVFRWIILLLFLAMLGLFTYSCTQLEDDEEQIKVFPSWHNYGKSSWLRLYGFRESENDEKLRVYFVWGLKTLDTSKCDYKNIVDVNECSGSVVWDETLNVNKPENQIALKNLCKRLRELSASEIDRLKIKVNLTSGEPEVECFMDKFESYMLNHVKTRTYNAMPNVTVFPPNVDMSIPITKEKMTVFMNHLPWIYRNANFSNDFTNWLEIGLDYWLANGYKMTNFDDYSTFSKLLGHWKTNHTLTIQSVYQSYGNQMKYFAIRFNTTLNAKRMSYATGLPIMQHWENLMREINDDLPAGLKNGFLATPDTPNAYHTMNIQKTLVYQAIYGLGIGILVACPVLVIGTMNIITGIVATLTITFTTVCVVGVIPLAGWKIGALESLNLCLVVGLSVDYIVHLAEGYYYAPYDDRKSRTQNMLEEVGISVTAGAITTLGASFFMLFCRIQFNYQFGLFLFCSIGFSWVFAIGFFTTFMALAGPNKEKGSIKPLFRFLKEKCCLKR